MIGATPCDIVLLLGVVLCVVCVAVWWKICGGHPKPWLEMRYEYCSLLCCALCGERVGVDTKGSPGSGDETRHHGFVQNLIRTITAAAAVDYCCTHCCCLRTGTPCKRYLLTSTKVSLKWYGGTRVVKCSCGVLSV